ncbi:leucine-rich repeat-containing protein 51-like [Prorops nasuta]|uniref:leucine-rich repeat-containing protein 51-like n=1 Tax=Prorops nasuta TaxID=863751 RepID=UPI0034CE5949
MEIMTEPTSSYQRNLQEEIFAGPPYDLSFKGSKTINALVKKKAESIRTGKLPKRMSDGRFITSSLWLNNNLLNSISDLKILVDNLLMGSSYLHWLELSFNKIYEIEDEIYNFPNLKILYLHGNKITDINQIMKLRKLLRLRMLTLHGNPIENTPNYRSFIIHILPQIKTLDFSPILSADRKKVLPAGFFRKIDTTSFV